MLLDGLYPNLISGMITREEYDSLKKHYLECSGVSEAHLEELKAKEQELAMCGPENPMFEVHRMLRGTAGLSEELIHALVARIEVHNGNRLDIKLVYQDEFVMLTQFVEGVSAS